jgi:hypothetical protein
MTQYILPTLYVHIVVIVDSTKVPVLIFFLIYLFFFVWPWPDSFFLTKRWMMPRHTLDPCYACFEY